MLHATRHLFSRSFTVSMDGEPLAEVIPARFGERAGVTIAGDTHALSRESILGGTFAMRAAGQVVATARKPNAFFRAFEVDLLIGRRFELKALGVWRRAFGLFESGTQVGSIAPAGWFRRGAVIDLPVAVPLAEQVFLTWLVLCMWRRPANSSSAAAAGS